MHCERRILGMLLNDHMAKILWAANGSSKSKRTLKGELPSTRRGLLLEVSPRFMVSITLRPLHLSPNS